MQVSVIIILRADEETVKIVHLVGEQEVCGVLVGRLFIIDDVEAAFAEGQFKVFKEQVVGTDRGPLFFKVVGDDEEEVIESEVVFPEDALQLIGIAHFSGDLAVKADHGAVLLAELDDISAVRFEHFVRAFSLVVKDLFKGQERFAGCQAVLCADPVPDLLHEPDKPGMFDAETEVFEDIYIVVGLCALRHGDQDLLGVLGLGHAFFFFYTGDRGQIVDPVRNFDVQGFDCHIFLKLDVGEGVALFFGRFVLTEVPVAQGCDGVHGLCHCVPEQPADLGHRYVAVLHDIVQERGHEVVTLKSLLSQDSRHAHRMKDVGLPGPALDALMLFAGVLVGAFDPFAVTVPVTGSIQVHDLIVSDIQFVGHAVTSIHLLCRLFTVQVILRHEPFYSAGRL